MIGEEIKKARKAKKMSMAELGEKVGACPATIYKIECGATATLKTSLALRLSEVLDMPMSRLTGEESDDSEIGEIYEKVKESGENARRLEEYCAASGDEGLAKKAEMIRKAADLFYEAARDAYEYARKI